MVYTVRVLSRDDLNRQVVKSASSTVEIPEFQLTIPASRGQLTTIEGLIRDTVADLSADQPLRRIENEAAYNKIQSIIDGFKDILADGNDDEEEKDTLGEIKPPQNASGKDAPIKPFTVRLDDPSGASFIEFFGSMNDAKWNMRSYHRTRQQNIDLGLLDPDAPEVSPADAGEGEGPQNPNEEIFVFPGTCSSCGHAINTLMKKVNIPYFTVCRFTRYRRTITNVLRRMSLLCLPTVTNVGIATTRSSPVLRSLRRENVSRLRLRTRKTSAVTSSRASRAG